MPSIDPFDDIDPMLSDGNEQSDDRHLLAVCDVSAEQFKALSGRKIQESDDDTDDSEWEEAENLSSKSHVDNVYFLFIKDRDLLYDEITVIFLDLVISESFSRENEDNFRLAKVFSAKFVPKIVSRESFCQTFRFFFPREGFCP